MIKLALLLPLISLCLSACSSVPYNPRREVRIDKKWYGTQFYQGQNRINPSTISKKLAEKPALQKDMAAFDTKYRIHQASGLLGGFILIGSIFSGNANAVAIGVGSLLLGGSLYFEKAAGDVLAPHVAEKNRLVYNYNLMDHYQLKRNAPAGFLVPVYSARF